MDDAKIIDLFWARDETAVTETAKKYSGYCFHISYFILRSNEDAEECVNDTYLNAWNSIPPRRPDRLSAFLGRITRNLALQRYAGLNAQKRGAGQVDIALHELEDCIPDRDSESRLTDEIVLTETLNSFLGTLPKQTRTVFVLRYWSLCSVKEISEVCGMSESKIKSMLFRTRNKLRHRLETEGIVI